MHPAGGLSSSEAKKTLSFFQTSSGCVWLHFFLLVWTAAVPGQSSCSHALVLERRRSADALNFSVCGCRFHRASYLRLRWAGSVHSRLSAHLLFCFPDGKDGKNRDTAAASSSSSSSSAKPKVKSSSSIAGIAHCWQGVVQRQVSCQNAS